MPNPGLSPEQQRQAVDLLNEALADGWCMDGSGKGSAMEEASRRGARRGFAKNVHTMRNRVTRAIAAGVLPAIPPAPPADPAAQATDRREVTSLRDKIRSLETQLKAADREHLTEEGVREQILKLCAATPDPPKWLLRVSGGSGVTGVPVTIWSDWHCGEVVNLAEMNGVNEYNLEIADQRIRRLVDRTIDLCFRHMTNPSYPGIVVNLLGDFVSGALHPELAESDELDIFPTILWARDRLIWALDQISQHFPAVFCPCAPGNHGRVLDKKPRAKGYAYRNADWLLYCLLEAHFQTVGNDRIKFSIPASGEVLYRVLNHRFLAMHGDMTGVKGGDGIIGMLGPVARGEIKVHTSSSQIDRDYDTLLVGHWHQSLFLPRVIVANCLKGPDEYARMMLRAPATAPSQPLWFVHPQHGITAYWNIRVDDRKVRAPAEWCSWSNAA